MASRPDTIRRPGSMHARIRERRRGVARDRGRRRLGVFLAVLLVAAAVAGGLWVRSSDLFAVERVILPVSPHIREDELRRALGELAGVNLLRVDVGSLEQSLAAIPYVRSARVYRRFPDALEVNIEEYRAFAVVQGRDGRRWLMADDGRVLETTATTPQGLLLVVPLGAVWPDPGGVAADEVVATLPLSRMLRDPEVWPAAHPVGHVTVDDAGETVMVLKSGLEVRLGEAKYLEQKLMVARTIIDQYLRKGGAPAYVDVHDPKWAVAKPKGP